MRVLSVILIMMLYSLFMWSPQALAQPVDASGERSQNHDAAKYWDSVQKQRRVNQCLRRRSGECYKKYQEAVDWCLKNWNECLPMIRRTGVYAGAYGQQVAEKCRKELEEECRAEAGK